MKKFLKTGVVALSCACALTLTSCGATGASASIVPNWYSNTTLTQAISETYEKLTYKVEYEKGTNEVYQVSYEPGVYTVILQDATHEGKLVYKLTSELQISGTFTMGSESKTFTDSVVTECYFQNAGNALYPLYSKKTVNSTTPRASEPKSLAEAIAEYSYTMEVTYGDGTAKSVYTDLKDATKNATAEYKLKDEYTVLDNESLLFAVRGVSLSSEASSYAYVLNPYNRTQEMVGITLVGQNAEAKYTFKNVDAGDAEAKEYTVDTNTVTIVRNATLEGKTLTAEYAATKSGANTYRSVMLRLKNPLSFGMGTLIYTLTEADFTDK